MVNYLRNFINEISNPALWWRPAVAVAMVVGGTGLAAQPVVLSTSGSGRATAYVESPKIVSRDGRTHVAWLDSTAEGFRVRVRSLDRATGEWGATVTVGEAEDNHGGPALTIDAAGHLHVLYYSHHHPFRYRRSLRPHDASAWTPDEEFGHNLTYPALVCARDGTLILVARRSHDDRPWELELWTRPPGQPWRREGAVLRSRRTNYAQFAASLAWSPDHATLHLGARILELPTGELSEMHAGVVHLTSADDGRSWRTTRGASLALPATLDTAEPLVLGSTNEDRILHFGSIDVGPDGTVAVPYSVRVQDTAQAYVALRAPGAIGWRHRWLNRHLPADWLDAALLMHGGAAFDDRGRLTVLATVLHLAPDGVAWGEPGTEVVRFRSDDGGATFRADLVGAVDPAVPHWMPNVERRTGFNPVEHGTAFLYTAGEAGNALHDRVSNEVRWVPGEPMPAPVALGERRELFADGALVASLDGLTHRLAPPHDAGAVLHFDRPWEQAAIYVTVLRDGDRYRLYYRGGLPVAADGKRRWLTCTAESADGVNWVKPELDVFHHQGQRTNVVLAPDPRHGASHNFVPMLDDRPGVPAAERYKGVGGSFHADDTESFDGVRPIDGLHRFVSADGIHWRRLELPPLFPGYPLDSQNVLVWLPAERCYAIYLRTWTGDTPGAGPSWAGFRTISRSTSTDFVHWTDPVPMDFGGAPAEHLYTNATQPYFRAPHLLVAMPFRFWPDRQAYPREQHLAWGVPESQAAGVSDAVLMTSRGGSRYDRTFLQSFVRPGGDPQAWHARNNAPSNGLVPTGPREMSFYILTHYNLPSAQLRRLVLRTDGLASIHAGYGAGTLLTRPVTFAGTALELNLATSAAGHARVDLLDAADGTVLAASEPLVGDQIDRRVSWTGGGDLAAWSGRPVRLRFELKDADLYAFRFLTPAP